MYSPGGFSLLLKSLCKSKDSIGAEELSDDDSNFQVSTSYSDVRYAPFGKKVWNSTIVSSLETRGTRGGVFFNNFKSSNDVLTPLIGKLDSNISSIFLYSKFAIIKVFYLQDYQHHEHHHY